MSIYRYWTCPELKEWFDPHQLGDNLKYPAGESAVVLMELLCDGRWSGCAVRLMDDRSDLPWKVEASPSESGWSDISSHATQLLRDSGFVFVDDSPAHGVYRFTRVVDELRRGQLDQARDYLPRKRFAEVYEISERDRVAITPTADGLIPGDNLVYGALFTLAGRLLAGLEHADALAEKAEAERDTARAVARERGWLRPLITWRVCRLGAPHRTTGDVMAATAVGAAKLWAYEQTNLRIGGDVTVDVWNPQGETSAEGGPDSWRVVTVKVVPKHEQPVVQIVRLGHRIEVARLGPIQDAQPVAADADAWPSAERIEQEHAVLEEWGRAVDETRVSFDRAGFDGDTIDFSYIEPRAIRAMAAALDAVPSSPETEAMQDGGHAELAWLREVLEVPLSNPGEPHALHFSRLLFRDRVLALLWRPLIAVPEAARAYGSYRGSDEQERVRLRVVLWQDLGRLQKAIRAIPGAPRDGA